MGIPTRHKISGAVDKNTPEHYLEHPVLGKNLEPVSEGTKPYLPEMHKPRTGEEAPVAEVAPAPEASDAKAAPAPKAPEKKSKD